MQFDTFFSICQTEVDGFLPDERTMFSHFFEQVELADALGFGTAWVAESHLSCQVQKRNPGAVIPHFKGEIGINVDILQLAHAVYARTERIKLGSAVMNILCNGGPIAHAERVRYFLSLHSMASGEPRGIDIGFAAGRFPFINIPYGVVPRSPVEQAAWPVLRGLIFKQATEIFLRLVKGEELSSDELEPLELRRAQFRSDDDWDRVLKAHGRGADSITVPAWWQFPYLTIVPCEAPLDHLRLTIGSHDPAVQAFANTILPVGVFNLSITSGKIIEETNRRMQDAYHSSGGEWRRSYMPRTVLVYINEDQDASQTERRERADVEARHALSNYWAAVEGTLDPEKVENAVDNALVGDAARIIEQIRERFDSDDRLMLWFDFNDHDSAHVMQKMRLFRERVIPALKDSNAAMEERPASSR